MTEDFDYAGRQREVVDSVLKLALGAGRTASVSGELSGPFADALSDALRRGPADSDATGPVSPGTMDIWLTSRRTARDKDRVDAADVVIDVTDPEWPLIRYVGDAYEFSDASRRRETQAFFAVRAATWELTFGDDLPAYARAVAEAGIPSGATVADVGCGTGRALPALRSAVGPAGTVLGIDLTRQMLDAIRDHGRHESAYLMQSDAEHLPLADRTLDAIFAAGLLPHTTSAGAVLTELARVCRAGGILVLFHPSGREQLARRHGRSVRPDDTLSRGPLELALATAGWRLDRYDDAPERFFALAVRESIS